MLAERSLGRLNIQVPVVGFGADPIAKMERLVSEAEAIETIHEALNQGIRLFDTAPYYGSTLSETRLGKGLAGTPRERTLISTKVGRLFDANANPGDYTWDYSRDGVLRSLEGSLARLKVDKVDLVYIHDPDQRPQDYLTAVREAFPALAELRSQGVIRGIGVGINQWQMLADFTRDTDLDVVLLAGRYTLLEQSALNFLNECGRRKIGVVLGGVFNSGILATGAISGATYNYAAAPTPILERARHIETVCNTHSIPLPAAALQFVLAHPAVSAALLGMASIAEVRANFSSLNQIIPPELWRDLRSDGLIDPEVPLPGQ